MLKVSGIALGEEIIAGYKRLVEPQPDASVRLLRLCRLSASLGTTLDSEGALLLRSSSPHEPEPRGIVCCEAIASISDGSLGLGTVCTLEYALF